MTYNIEYKSANGWQFLTGLSFEQLASVIHKLKFSDSVETDTIFIKTNDED